MYFIPLVSIHKDKYKSESRIYPTKKNKLQKVSHPNVRVLIEKPIAFCVNCGTLMNDDIHNTFKDIMKYYKFVLADKSHKAVSLAINYFKKEEKYVDDALVTLNKTLGLVKQNDKR